MRNLIKSEFIKGRRSFGRKSLVLFPLLTALMAIVLMGGRSTQIGAFNWWYMILFPTVAALVCMNLIGPEKRNQFFNVLVLPTPETKIWIAKILTGCCYLLCANLLVFGLTTISGFAFSAQYPVWSGISAAFVLTMTWAWQVPLGLFAAARFGSSVTLIGLLGLNLIFSVQDVAGGDLWFIPFAIPARLMAPILGINPNGIPLEVNSPLYDTGVILPGLLIASNLFVIVLFVTTKWFERQGD